MHMASCHLSILRSFPVSSATSLNQTEHHHQLRKGEQMMARERREGSACQIVSIRAEEVQIAETYQWSS
jgi:hypothetical protein